MVGTNTMSRGFLEYTLYDTIMRDTCHYTFVQTTEYTTRRENPREFPGGSVVRTLLPLQELRSCKIHGTAKKKKKKKMNPDVNCERWVIKMCQFRFINYNKCTILVEDVDNGEAMHMWGFSGGSVVKTPPINVGDTGLTPGSGRLPEEGNGNLLQYSCLGNPMDRGTWQITVHGVARESDIVQLLSHV